MHRTLSSTTVVLPLTRLLYIIIRSELAAAGYHGFTPLQYTAPTRAGVQSWVQYRGTPSLVHRRQHDSRVEDAEGRPLTKGAQQMDSRRNKSRPTLDDLHVTEHAADGCERRAEAKRQQWPNGAHAVPANQHGSEAHKHTNGACVMANHRAKPTLCGIFVQWEDKEAEERQAELDAARERELERQQEIEKERDSIAERDRGHSL